ncbi:MAG: HAMP domain-containing sensor histidine kinase [Pseudomonadota bacterium]
MTSAKDFSQALVGTPAEAPDHSWRALWYFNWYRITVAVLFFGLALTGKLPPNLTSFDVRQFGAVAAVFIVGATMSQIALVVRWGHYRYQVYAAVVVDIVVFTLIIHASGGIGGGFGILLIISVAGACLLIRGVLPILFAALATIAVLAETSYGVQFMDYPVASYTASGLLGAALFGSAILATVLAEQARRSEVLAAERAVDIENLSRLNEYIVQRMRSGILVLDDASSVVHMNDAAQTMVGVAPGGYENKLADVSKPISAAYRSWVVNEINSKNPVDTGEQGQSVVASFTGLADGGTLVFLEDAAEMQQRAQQLKLASLGRLTASIAHEIRNPLGAISHAGQLLSESPDMHDQDQRLTEIIAENSARMNRIIENVLSIGKRNSTIGESFALLPWVNRFIEELSERKGFSGREILFTNDHEDIVVQIDKGQLHQVLWNLCENGLRYSQRNPLLHFDCGIVPTTSRPYLDIGDSGSGMDEETAEQAFEPFYTGETKGTGLGLYLARELCESNQASLTLIKNDPTGCCFRIYFAHPDRQQLNA